MDEAGVYTYSLKLAKGRRDRDGEEDVVSRLVLAALARACGAEIELPLGLLPEERLEVEHAGHDGPIKQLLAGEGGQAPGMGCQHSHRLSRRQDGRKQGFQRRGYAGFLQPPP